jgi:hypothetical protein
MSLFFISFLYLSHNLYDIALITVELNLGMFYGIMDEMFLNSSCKILLSGLAMMGELMLRVFYLLRGSLMFGGILFDQWKAINLTKIISQTQKKDHLSEYIPIFIYSILNFL